jgi:hypothetical protein
MTGNPNIDVPVIVSGEEVVVRVNPHEKVRELVRKALHESGNVGRQPEEWVLRSDAGTIEQDQTIADAGIVAGTKLYLNPSAGEGGC